MGKKPQVDELKSCILKQWKSKDLRAAETFVGFQIQRDRHKRKLKIHQTIYIDKLLKRLNMDKSNPTLLPIPAETVLKPDEDNLLDITDAAVYRQIVGSANYLVNNTRLDISYAVGQLARFMSKPARTHFQHAKQLLQYLNGTKIVGIIYSNRLKDTLHAYKLYSDAILGTEDNRVLFQGWAVLGYGGAISWALQQQKSTS